MSIPLLTDILHDIKEIADFENSRSIFRSKEPLIYSFDSVDYEIRAFEFFIADESIKIKFGDWVNKNNTLFSLKPDIAPIASGLKIYYWSINSKDFFFILSIRLL